MVFFPSSPRVCTKKKRRGASYRGELPLCAQYIFGGKNESWRGMKWMFSGKKCVFVFPPPDFSSSACARSPTGKRRKVLMNSDIFSILLRLFPFPAAAANVGEIPFPPPLSTRKGKGGRENAQKWKTFCTRAGCGPTFQKLHSFREE